MKIFNLKNCARCGENHGMLTAKPFKKAIDDYTYWAKCPTSGDPILIKQEYDCLAQDNGVMQKGKS